MEVVVDATATRKAAMENNFIAALYERRFDQGEREGRKSVGISVRRYLFHQ